MNPPEHLKVARWLFAFRCIRKILRHIDHSSNSYQLILTYGDKEPRTSHNGVLTHVEVSGFEFADEKSLNKEYERAVTEWKKWREFTHHEAQETETNP